MVEGDDRLQHALEFAYRYLNRRERTMAEVRRHLAARGVDAAVAEATIEALRGQGHLDDARFARTLVEEKRELESWGAERILRTLLARGIDRDLARDTMDEPPVGDGPAGELERAIALLRRRFPSPPADLRQRDRALGVLLRKGYGSELALEALAAHSGRCRDDDLR